MRRKFLGFLGGASVMAGGLVPAFADTSVNLSQPSMPDPTSTMQTMVDSFGQAGSYAIAIIGGAVALGVMVILAMYAWRLLKRWLHTAK